MLKQRNRKRVKGLRKRIQFVQDECLVERMINFMIFGNSKAE